jgi:hypothetical protein
MRLYEIPLASSKLSSATAASREFSPRSLAFAPDETPALFSLASPTGVFELEPPFAAGKPASLFLHLLLVS